MLCWIGNITTIYLELQLLVHYQTGLVRARSSGPVTSLYPSCTIGKNIIISLLLFAVVHLRHAKTAMY